MLNSEYESTSEKSSDIAGFTKIPNNILDALCRVRMPGEAVQVFMTITRQTYGWKKSQDKIALSTLSKKTGILRHKLIRSIKTLEEMKIIIADRDTYITTYRINSDTDIWLQKPISKTVPKNGNTCKLFQKMGTEVLPKIETGVPKNGNKTVPKNGTLKRKKEIITKDTHKESDPPIIETETDVQNVTEKKDVCASSFFNFKSTSLYLCDAIRRNGAKVNQPDIDAWSRTLSSIGDPPEQLELVIDFAQNHSFWKSRTLTAENFAKNYSTIRLQMEEQNAKDTPVDSGVVGNGLQRFSADDPSLFANPGERMSDNQLAWIFDSVRACKTISALAKMWSEHSEYNNYDILVKERNFRISSIASRKIKFSRTLQELESAFDEAEMIFTACVPSISQKYAARYEELTGEPFLAEEVEF